jgi:hypothetical protein
MYGHENDPEHTGIEHLHSFVPADKPKGRGRFQCDILGCRMGKIGPGGSPGPKTGHKRHLDVHQLDDHSEDLMFVYPRHYLVFKTDIVISVNAHSPHIPDPDARVILKG